MEILKMYKAAGEFIAIEKYPNGKYYNHYGYDFSRGMGNCTAGGFQTLEEAEEMVKRHRPKAEAVHPVLASIYECRKEQERLKRLEKLESDRAGRFIQRVKDVTGKDWDVWDDLMGKYDHIALIP